MEKTAEQDPRVYFAAERTLLAWLRTGLGLMGIGFAVSRFGLFLRELGAARAHVNERTLGISLWSGVSLVALGVIVNVNAVVRHYRLIHELASGEWQAGKVSGAGIALGAILAIIGVAMAVYLVIVH